MGMENMRAWKTKPSRNAQQDYPENRSSRLGIYKYSIIIALYLNLVVEFLRSLAGILLLKSELAVVLYHESYMVAIQSTAVLPRYQAKLIEKLRIYPFQGKHSR